MQKLTCKMVSKIQDMTEALNKNKASGAAAVARKENEVEVLKTEIEALTAKLAGAPESAGALGSRPAQVHALSAALEVSHQKMLQAQQRAEALGHQVQALERERDSAQEEQKIQNEELKIKRMRQVVGRLMSRSLATAFDSWIHVLDRVDMPVDSLPTSSDKVRQGISNKGLMKEELSSSQGDTKDRDRAAGEVPPTSVTASDSPRSSAPEDVQVFIEGIVRRAQSDVGDLIGPKDQILVSSSV